MSNPAISTSELSVNELIDLAPLNPEEIITNYAPLSPQNDPLIMIAVGIFIALLSGIGFGYLIQVKIKNWKDNEISPVPLSNPNTIITWTGLFSGLTIIFISALSIFNFPIIQSFIFSLFIAITFGISMWRSINDLIIQIKDGEVKEIDEFF